jgi:hypothetical protein
VISLSPRAFLLIGVFGFARLVCAQQAVAPIEQARLFEKPAAAPIANVNADGAEMVSPSGAGAADDSFGAQIIMKTQERLRAFAVSGSAAIFYTSNAALTRSGAISDAFAVVDASVAWRPKIGSQLEAEFAAHGAFFRYNETRELDFENLGLSAALSWQPPACPSVSLFARYDFTELLNGSSDEILRDHQLTIGAQKTFVLGRSHALFAGLSGSARISDPDAAQRDEVGPYLGYHLRISRSLNADLFYRFAFHFYNQSSRIDRNQTLSLGLRYSLTDWADVSGTASLGFNRSDSAAFDYDVFNAGGGVGVTVRF